MSTKDHNETVAGIHLAAGGFLVMALVIAPLLLIRDLERHTDQIPLAVIGFVVLLALAAFMVSTAVAMNRKRPAGRKLALWAAPLLFLMFWPAGAYSWWFLHSVGAKKMYRVKEE